MNYASGLSRIFAGTLDFLTIFIAFAVTGLMLKKIGLSNDTLTIILMLSFAAYTPLMCASKMQGTLGMKLCKQRMVSEDGGAVSLKQAFSRSAVELVFAGLGSVLFQIYVKNSVKASPTSQLWHDSLFKTYIVSDSQIKK